MNWLGLGVCALVFLAIDVAFKTTLRRAAAADVASCGGSFGFWLYFRPEEGGSWRWVLWLAILAFIVLAAKEFRDSFSVDATREFAAKLKS